MLFRYPVTRSINVPTSFSQYCTIPHALIFHVFQAKSTTVWVRMRLKRRLQRSEDGHTLKSVGETRGLTWRRRPLSRRRSTTGGGVARRCYSDTVIVLRTSRRHARKICFGLNDGGGRGYVVFHRSLSFHGELRTVKGLKTGYWIIFHNIYLRDLEMFFPTSAVFVTVTAVSLKIKNNLIMRWTTYYRTQVILKLVAK